MTVIPADDERVIEAATAIHTGDLAALRQLFAQHPELAIARIGSEDGCEWTRTLLHVATDWPGHYPNGPAIVRLLVEAGADPNARFAGPHTETPLHWAASSDDVDVIDALLDLGADIDANGAVIAEGTPLTDATAFGQWNAAQRLLDRGAHVGAWEAAVMGLDARLEECLAANPPDAAFLNGLFWGACHGGRRSTAELLLARGADINWSGWDDLTPLGAAERENRTELAGWLRDVGAKRP